MGSLQIAQNAINLVNKGRSQEPNYGVAPVKVPTGGIGISSPDGVDPRDCQRYPNSPYCGGSGLSILPVGYEVDVKNYGQTTCVRLTPVVVFVTGAPLFVCGHNPFIPPPKPSGSYSINKPLPPRPKISPLPSVCTARVILSFYIHTEFALNYYNETIGHVYDVKAEQFGGDYAARYDNIPGYTGGFSPYPASMPDLSNYNESYILLESTERVPSENPSPVPRYRIEWISVGFNTDSGFSDVDEKMAELFETFPAPWEIVGIIPSCNFPAPRFSPVRPRDKQPPYKPTPESPKDMPCCDETNDLLRMVLQTVGGNKLPKAYSTGGVGSNVVITNLPDLIELFAKRAEQTNGSNEYPITVPSTLIGNGTETTTITSTGAFLIWIVKQLDGLIGEFPLQIKIKDIDPLKSGDQEQIIDIPNLAEGMAEMYGMNVRGTINSELILNFLTRMASEVLAVKNMAVTTQDYVKANASWLGYRGEPVKRKIHSALDYTGDPSDVAQVLRESDVEISGWKDTDKENLVTYLQKLLFSAGIIKGVFFRGKNEKDLFQREIEAALESGSTKTSDETWDRYKNLLNNPNSIFNEGQITPDIQVDEVKLSDGFGGKNL
ncbi:hypothetical protein TUMEXPCC7403_17005 [Tumidithrix helvetica PCC 7403]|uniref:hypothetical protein n=1 Tax=Tumidithrix helvetica TaxID=3457545 RepID=UPI003CC3573A